MIESFAVGPVFDGRAVTSVESYAFSVQAELAQQAVNAVRTRLTQVIKVWGDGYYASQVQTSNQIDDVSVNDGGVVYGPWLEGVGSRNQSTRFKGYATFRTVSQAFDHTVTPIAEAALTPYVLEMNA